MNPFATHAIIYMQASCLSAVALSTESDGKIIDACAAPGMKTSLLAALSHKKR